VFLDSPVILDRMLAACRAAKLPKMSSPIRNLEVHLKAFDNMLLGMPTAMQMKGDDIRPHLIWKHMLAATAEASVTLSNVSVTLLGSIGPDFCNALKAIPSWLLPRKLAGQVGCPVEFLSMWICLWKDILELEGAADAVFRDTLGIKRILEEHLGKHGYPPSPYELMCDYLKVPEDSAGANFVDAHKRAAMRSRSPRRHAVAAGDDLMPSPSHVSRPCSAPVTPADFAPPGQHPRLGHQLVVKSPVGSAAMPAVRPPAKTARPKPAATLGSKAGGKAHPKAGRGHRSDNGCRRAAAALATL
jgi:hypothetical protein